MFHVPCSDQLSTFDLGLPIPPGCFDRPSFAAGWRASREQTAVTATGRDNEIGGFEHGAQARRDGAAGVVTGDAAGEIDAWRAM
jgi:hypothetical protein